MITLPGIYILDGRGIYAYDVEKLSNNKRGPGLSHGFVHFIPESSIGKTVDFESKPEDERWCGVDWFETHVKENV